MDRYQIYEQTEKANHAGSKAVLDVCSIANEMMFKEETMVMHSSKPGIVNKIIRQLYFLKDQKRIFKDITNESFILLQHPLYFRQLHRDQFFLNLKKKKNAKFISLVHDVYELRTKEPDDYFKHEFDFMCQFSDMIIVHNKVMMDYFIKKGVEPEKLICLEIFDYLIPNYKYSTPNFSKKIVIAGNLNPNKSAYLKELYSLDVNFELFGPNFDESINKSQNIHYNGSLPADEVPNALTSGFGLIWDGLTTETCSGDFGEYLKYNNPHKLSLYLASGLPVIIWAEAAEAEFVKKYNLGFAVNSLNEIPFIFNTLTEDEYCNMANNVKDIASKLTSGYFTKKAITEAINKL